MEILKGILQSKQPKAYKQITRDCLNLPRAGSLLQQTEPESAKGQSTTRGNGIGNSCMVLFWLHSPAMLFPGPVSPALNISFSCHRPSHEILCLFFFFSFCPVFLWFVDFSWSPGKVYVLCFWLFPGERNISPGLFKSSSILKMECL